MMVRTGRRRGRPDTRETILTAARSAFAEAGFDAVTIRRVAADAGVDPALVHHYFGTKEQLFLATVDAPIDPGEMITKVLAEGPEQIPQRLVRAFLSVWDDPVTGPAAVAVLRGGLRHDWSTRMLREFVTTMILRRVLAELNLAHEEARLRGSLVASQMIGLAMIRYVLRLEPLASAEPDVVVGAIAPTIRRYLTQPLDSSLT